MAYVYAKTLEIKCEDQIKQYLDHPLFADTKVRIMPDVHLGKGSVIGFTATCNEYVVPNLIGVDIGCGVSAFCLGRGAVPFDKLDKFIRKHIPAGKKVNDEIHPMLEEAYDYVGDYTLSFEVFMERVVALTDKFYIPTGRVLKAIGSLGGGNHFIEIDKDEEGCRWLLIHSGSRNLGLNVATFHSELAVERTHEDSSIKFLSGRAAEDYMEDMKIAQLYARVNRALMGIQIGWNYFKVGKTKLDCVESIHNYIDFENAVVRKGAISARKDEMVVIPFSMADGAVIGKGCGNAEWNYSAPHGSGRKLSRTQAQGLSLDEYRKRMKNIWSSCVGKSTLDESPMAYKNTKEILELLGDTVDVERRLMPVYNFKSS